MADSDPEEGELCEEAQKHEVEEKGEGQQDKLEEREHVVHENEEEKELSHQQAMAKVKMELPKIIEVCKGMINNYLWGAKEQAQHNLAFKASDKLFVDFIWKGRERFFILSNFNPSPFECGCFSFQFCFQNDPLLCDLPAEVTLEELNSEIALEYGQAMTVNVRRADNEVLRKSLAVSTTII